MINDISKLNSISVWLSRNISKLKYLIVFVWLFTIACEKRCKDSELTHYGFLYAMDQYFNVYNVENWWVYRNQDSSKIDSVFISDYKLSIKKVTLGDCFDYPDIEFYFNSQFFISETGQSNFKGHYFNNQSCCINYIYCGFKATMNGSIDTHPKSNSVVPEILYPSLVVGNVNYRNVLALENGSLKTFHVENIGIVMFVTQSDTFSLTKYHVR